MISLRLRPAMEFMLRPIKPVGSIVGNLDTEYYLYRILLKLTPGFAATHHQCKL